MPAWAITVLIAAGGFLLTFIGWVVVKILDIQTKIAGLEQRLNETDTRCAERLEWLRSMDTKLDHGEKLTRVLTILVTGDHQPKVQT
jgi:hypothetical protein